MLRARPPSHHDVYSGDNFPVHFLSPEVPAAVLDMKATQAQSSEAHGVARAIFSGRTLDDMSGTDRHIAIGISGKQDNSGQVTIHSVDVYGVNPQE